MSTAKLKRRLSSACAAALIAMLFTPGQANAVGCAIQDVRGQFQFTAAGPGVYRTVLWADAPGCVAGAAYGVATPSNTNGTRAVCTTDELYDVISQDLSCGNALPLGLAGTPVVITGPVSYVITGEFYAVGTENPRLDIQQLTYSCTVTISVTGPGDIHPFACTSFSS